MIKCKVITKTMYARELTNELFMADEVHEVDNRWKEQNVPWEIDWDELKKVRLEFDSAGWRWLERVRTDPAQDQENYLTTYPLDAARQMALDEVQL